MTKWIYGHFSEFTTEINYHCLLLFSFYGIAIHRNSNCGYLVVDGFMHRLLQQCSSFVNLDAGRSAWANYQIMTSKNSLSPLNPPQSFCGPALYFGRPALVNLFSAPSRGWLSGCQVVEFQAISSGLTTDEQTARPTPDSSTDQPSPDSRQTTTEN